MAFLELVEHIVRYRFAHRRAVFDGQAVDNAEFNLAGGNTVGEELFKDGLGRLGDDGTDSVASADSDDDFVKLIVIDKVGGGVDPLDSGELTLEYSRELSQALLICAS